MTQNVDNYAQALFELARDEQLDTPVLQQLQALDASFKEEPGFLRLLAAPGISKEERCSVIDGSFREQVHPYVVNFLKILTEKGYIRQFSSCVKGYTRAYNRHHGILPVRAVSAVELTQEQRQRLMRKLQDLTGKTIQLECRVDPACLGGLRLDYDGKQVDGTVQSRLKAVHDMIKNTVL